MLGRHELLAEELRPTRFVTGIEKRRFTLVVRNAVSRCGGSVWESNPPEPPKAPPSGFEDRASHQAKSAPPGQATL